MEANKFLERKSFVKNWKRDYDKSNMSVYLLPYSTIKDIERMMNSFWWGGGSN
jgi:hypothetical protein